MPGHGFINASLLPSSVMQISKGTIHTTDEGKNALYAARTNAFSVNIDTWLSNMVILQPLASNLLTTRKAT